jgi:hypothetical protein
MNILIKIVLLCSIGFSLAACNNDSSKYRGQAAAANSETSISQLLTSVFMRDANAEPVAVNSLNISNSFDNKVIQDLSAQ